APETRDRHATRLLRNRGYTPRDGRPGYASGCVSVRVGAEDLAAVSAAQRAVGRHADRGLEELHGTIGEREVGPAWVLALESLGGGAEPAAQGLDRRLPVAVVARGVGGREGGFEVERDRRAGRASVGDPEIIVAGLVGQDLADDDRVAGAVGRAADA